MNKDKDQFEKYDYGFNDGKNNITDFPKGLNEDIIKKISSIKKEPEWMLEIRLNAYKQFKEMSNECC